MIPRFLRRHPLWAILAVAVALRLVAAGLLGDGVRPLPGTFDQVWYDALAWRVATGHGFSFDQLAWPMTPAGAPTAHWSFLFTVLLAGIYAVAGHVPMVARVALAVATGVLAPLGAHRLAGRLFGPRVALWAAAITAGYAYFVYYGAALMTEMPTIVAVVWWLDRAVRLADAQRPAWRDWAIYGALVGVAALLRQVTLAPVPLVTLWLVAIHRDRRAVLGAALAAAVALALVAPVTLRNARVFDRFVLLNTNAGYAFFWANHPVYGTSFKPILDQGDPSYQDLVPAELRSLDEAALNDALMARGWAFVRADPARYLRLSLSRVDDYFMFWPSRASGRVSNAARTLSFGILWPFMLAGLWLGRHAWRRAMPLHIFVGSYTLVHLMSWALVRYRLPVDAVLLVFAALAAARGAAWLGARRGGGMPSGAGAAAAP